MAATGEIASNGMAASVRDCFPVAPESAGKARELVGEVLFTIGIPPGTIGDVKIMLTELITNAMVHGAAGRPDVGDIDLLIRTDDTAIHVEVTDPGLGGKPQVKDDLLAAGGRGLRLVDALASRWDHHEAPAGRTVWFDVDHPQVTTP